MICEYTYVYIAVDMNIHKTTCVCVFAFKLHCTLPQPLDPYLQIHSIYMYTRDTDAYSSTCSLVSRSTDACFSVNVD